MTITVLRRISQEVQQGKMKTRTIRSLLIETMQTLNMVKIMTMAVYKTRKMSQNPSSK